MKNTFRFLIALAAIYASAGLASADTIIPIDLNDFFADPTVTVALDGSMATIAEDPGFFTVLLANDPGLGDPEVIIAARGRLLEFEFDFVEPAPNDEEFGAFVTDASTGFSLGPAFEFFTDMPSSGTVSFDLTSLVGTTLGLQFQLSSLFADAACDSTVTVSDVRLVDPDVIPEPYTLALLALGVGVLVRRRTRAA